MYKVTFEGFRTLEEAKEFSNWFEGQGESDAAYWFEINGPVGDEKSPMNDLSKPDVVDEAAKTVTTYIKMV